MSKYHWTLLISDFDAWLAESLSPSTLNLFHVMATGVFMILTALSWLGVSLGWLGMIRP